MQPNIGLSGQPNIPQAEHSAEYSANFQILLQTGSRIVLLHENIIWPNVIFMEGQAGKYGYGKYGDQTLTTEDKRVSYIVRLALGDYSIHGTSLPIQNR